MKDILYVAARNEYGELILAKNASKNSTYVCPECGEEMILRKSVRLLRRPHFAHKNWYPIVLPNPFYITPSNNYCIKKSY